MSLRICFVSSETAPYAKTGGLADVSGALLKYLLLGGHEIRLFMPAYAAIDRAEFGLETVPELGHQSLQLGSHRYEFSVLSPRAPEVLVDGADVHVIRDRDSFEDQIRGEHIVDLKPA